MCFGSLFLPVFIIKCKFLGTPKFAFFPVHVPSCLCPRPTLSSAFCLLSLLSSYLLAASIGAACSVERGTTPAKPKPFAHTFAHNRNLTKYSTTIWDVTYSRNNFAPLAVRSPQAVGCSKIKMSETPGIISRKALCSMEGAIGL